MTVCVAAICQYDGGSVIIGASDRMLTAGNIEFEQEQRKIFWLTSSISLLVAGDTSTVADILYEVMATVHARIQTEPDNWWGVKDVADLFYGNLAALRRRRAEQEILHPLGLDYQTLTSPGLAPTLTMQLAKEMLEFKLPQIGALVIGIDHLGPHIYEVDNDGVSCQDWTGFSSIGAGAWHANSQLMFAGHVKTRALAETLLAVYTAKRRAEVAPGVGQQTDMIVIGPGLGATTIVGPPLMGYLETTYNSARTREQEVRREANARITEAVEAILRHQWLKTNILGGWLPVFPPLFVFSSESPQRAVTGESAATAL